MRIRDLFYETFSAIQANRVAQPPHDPWHCHWHRRRHLHDGAHRRRQGVARGRAGSIAVAHGQRSTAGLGARSRWTTSTRSRPGCPTTTSS